MRCMIVTFTPPAGVTLSSSPSGYAHHDFYVKGEYYIKIQKYKNIYILDKYYIP